MKKRVLIIAILGAFLFCSCSTSSSVGGFSIDLSTANTTVTNTDSSDNLQNVPSGISPLQTLKAVLLNEATFFCTDKSPYYSVVNQWNGYLNELTYNDNPMITPQFAVVDLDGDGVTEIVLAIENYNGFVILRYKEEKVYGNIVSYRTMLSLKKDGSFLSSSGASDHSIGKLLFIGDTFFLNEKICSVGGGVTETYYIHDMPIDKGTWDKHYDSFDNSPSIEWYDYSEETVNQRLIDSPASSDMPSQNIASSDRQEYLNSLAYLIELTYYNSGLESQEEINSNARSYYNGCNEELNKIYQLCSEKLSEDELEALCTEQQGWQDYFNQRLSRFLSDQHVTSMDELEDQVWYHSFGDIILRRTLRLINLYFDEHFYD